MVEKLRQSSEANDFIDLTALLGVIWRGKWFAALFAVLFGLGGIYIAFGVMNELYASKVRLGLEVETSNIPSVDNLFAAMSADDATINTEIEVIKSRNVLERLIKDTDLTRDLEYNPFQRPPTVVSRLMERIPFLPYEELSPTPQDEVNATVNTLLRAISVSSPRETYVLDIEVRSEDRHKAAKLANTFAETYIKYQIEAKIANTRQALSVLIEETRGTKSLLDGLEEELKELRRDSDLIGTETLELLNIRAKGLRDRLSVAEETEAKSQSAADGLRRAVQTEDLALSLEWIERSDLLRRAEAFDSASPSDQAATLRAITQYAEELTARATQAASQRVTLETAYDKLLLEIEKQNAELQQLNTLLNEVAITNELYRALLGRQKEMTAQLGLTTADANIMSYAIPGTLVAPQRPLIVVFSAFFGIVVAVLILVLRWFMATTRIRTSDQLENLTALHAVVEVPRMPLNSRGALENYLIQNPTSSAAEAVRNLRTSLLMSNRDPVTNEDPQIFMITSCLPGEGKTTLSICLCHNFTGLGKKVLLLEGDIRRLTLKEYFPTGNGGLEGVLNRSVAAQDAIFTSNLGFDVLHGGNVAGSATDVFASRNFKMLIEDLRKTYDYIIIDTPPVLVVPDARVIGASADVILLNVAWNRTSQDQVRRSLKQFSSIGLPVRNAVLSQVNVKAMKREYGAAYGGYGAYGGGYYN